MPLFTSKKKNLRVAVIGSGFSGLCAAIQVEKQLGIKAVIFEKESAAFGTWTNNFYPNCCCDVPSHLYSLSFEPNPDWSEHYSSQPEIRRYMMDVANKYKLDDRILLNTEVLKLQWDQDQCHWDVSFQQNKQGPIETQTFDAVFCGLGPLRIPNIPPAFLKFDGPWTHTAEWKDIDVTNKRVGIIGTGASAVQVIPYLQERAQHLYTFQRTPTWVAPRLQFKYASLFKFLFRYVPFFNKLYRLYLFLEHEIFFLNFKDHRSVFSKFIHRMFRKMTIVRLKRAGRPDLIPKLMPNYSPGCKRIVRSENYFETLAKPNVTVVTGGVQDIQGRTIITADGEKVEVDALILATGYDVEGFAGNLQVIGRNQTSLADLWQTMQPKTYKTATVHGYPNMYILLGPGSGLGHNSALAMIENQVEFGIRCLKYMQNNGIDAMEPTEKAQEVYTSKVMQDLKHSVWASGGCNSWYRSSADGNIYSLWSGTVTSFWYELRQAGFDTSFHFYNKRRDAPKQPQPYPLPPTKL
ncbi:putative flavoprotein [Gongronella butleri]|nr:putative flavoprotein [Gongronella butleri]